MAKLRTRKHKVVLARSRGGDAGITFVLVLLGVFMFIPMYYTFIQSLKPLDELWMYPPRFYVSNPTGKNFKDLFTLMSGNLVPFSRYIFNTVFTSIAGTIGHLFIASLAAYAMSRITFPGGRGMFKLVRTSLMFHATVTAITSFILMSALNLVDTYWAIIIPAWGSTLGLYLMKQFMEQIPDSLLESARLDGAGELRIFLTIVMPNVKPAWVTLAIFQFQAMWANTASGFIRSEELKPLQYALYQVAAGGVMRQGAAAVVQLIIALIPITFFLLCQKQVIETMTTSGMKE